MNRPPLPPFDEHTAIQKVRLAEDGWNSRDPEKVSLAYSLDSRWRNRAEFVNGRSEILAFLTRKWAKELDYRLIKDLWAFTSDRIAVRFAYEWHDDSGNWFRSYGNENWEFDGDGLMRVRFACINDLPIKEAERKLAARAASRRPPWVERVGSMTRKGSDPISLVSLNCGLPRQVEWRGQTVSTGIYKTPVAARIALRASNLDGDRQADLTVHGGALKAVYCYSVCHYDYWKKELLYPNLSYGSFGENFTIDGVSEDSVCIGDRFAVGTAEVVVTQPRLPCYKLALRFDSLEIVRTFLRSGRTGFYLAVIREGDVAAGDRLVRTHRLPESVAVSDVTRLFVAKRYDQVDLEKIRRLSRIDVFPDSWKQHFQSKLFDA